MKANKTNTDYQKTDMTKIIEPGMYKALIYSIIDLGTQETTFEGEKKQLRKVLLQFEIPEIMYTFSEEKGEQPVSVSSTYTMSMHPKSKLRGIVEGFVGTKLTDTEANNFDIDTMLGKTCMLNIAHNGEYVNVAGIGKIKSKEKELEPVNTLRFFDLDSYDEKLYQSFSKKLQETIQKSPERQEINKETKF